MLGLLLFYDGTARVEIIIICVNFFFFFKSETSLSQSQRFPFKHNVL